MDQKDKARLKNIEHLSIQLLKLLKRDDKIEDVHETCKW